ncbi:hypothetical protein, partial [uncultured Akkermansia sp.]|uniref:hypothetical protein n=1 Tax=uncultured Akkermansia sp. TaxID=512294 RepID=UPI0025CF64A6
RRKKMVSILSIKSILFTTLPAPFSALRTERPFQFYKTAQNTPAPPCPLSDVRKNRAARNRPVFMRLQRVFAEVAPTRARALSNISLAKN